MTLLSGIKSFLGFSEVQAEKQKEKKAEQTATSPQLNVGDMLRTGKVNNTESHSGDNGQSQNGSLSKGDEFTKTMKTDIEIDEDKLVKNYKKNPMQALNDESLGRTFSPEEAAQMEKLLKNKGDLKSYIELAKKENLSNEDVIAGMKELEDNKKSFLFIKWNKLDKEILSDKMSQFRQYRKDFKSKTIAHVSAIVGKKPELNAAVTHFVAKSERYSEKNVTQAADYMDKNEAKVEKFMNNVTSLEKIKKDDKGKYSGDTIVNISEKVTDNEEIRDTVYKAALKGDMNDEYLTNIVDKILKNMEMMGPLDQFLGLKDKDGNDRFSAKNISEQANYMVDKKKETIKQYYQNTMQLAGYAKLSGDNIVQSSANVTNYPETRAQVMQAAAAPESQISGDEVAARSSSYASEAQNGTYESPTSPIEEKASPKESYTSNDTKTPSFGLKNANTNDTIKNDEVQNVCRMKFANANDAEQVQKIIKTNPELKGVVLMLLNNKSLTPGAALSIIKTLGTPKLIKAYAENPEIFTKLSRYKNITSIMMEKLVDVAQGGKSELLFCLLAQGIDPLKAMTMTLSVRDAGTEQRLIDTASKNTVSKEDRLRQIDEQLNGKNVTSHS